MTLWEASFSTLLQVQAPSAVKFQQQLFKLQSLQ
jgi:hypothetical protein